MTHNSAAALTTVPTTSSLDPAVHARLRRIQIALNVRSMRANAYAMPVWAVFLSLVFSASAPVGFTSWTIWWIWPASCVLVSIAAYLAARNFRVSEDSDQQTLEFWYRCVLGLHLGVGLAWSLGVWVHWHDANAANHLFLFVIAI